MSLHSIVTFCSCDACWTRAQEGGGGFEHTPPSFFAQLFGQLFCNFPENLRSRLPKVRSPGHVRWPHPRKKINRLTATVREHQRGGGEGPGPPRDLKNTTFQGFLPLNYVIFIFEACFLSFLLCGRTEEACRMVNSLREVDFSNPTGHYTGWLKKCHS